jgi:hypothetical protein
MSIWLDKSRRRPDGRHKSFGQTTMRSASQNFAEILSCFEPRPDGVALSFGRSHFSCTQFPYQGLEHPDQENGHPYGWPDARNFHISSSCIQTMKADVRTYDFWMRDFPYDERVRTRIHIIRMVAVIRSNTKCLPDMLLKRPDGCKLEQFKASRHKGRSERKVLVV